MYGNGGKRAYYHYHTLCAPVNMHMLSHASLS